MDLVNVHNFFIAIDVKSEYRIDGSIVGNLNYVELCPYKFATAGTKNEFHTNSYRKLRRAR